MLLLVQSLIINTTDLGLRYSVREFIEMLSNGKTGTFVLFASKMFTEAFSECVTGLLNVESRTAMAKVQ